MLLGATIARVGATGGLPPVLTWLVIASVIGGNKLHFGATGGSSRQKGALVASHQWHRAKTVPNSIARRFTFVWVAIAVAAVLLWSSARQSTVAAEDSEPKRFDGPRDLFRLFDMDEAFFAAFAAGEDIDTGEQQKIYKILYRLRSFSPSDIHRWARRDHDSWQRMLKNPAEFAGQLYEVRGTAKRVEPIALSAPDRERFDLEHAAICEFETADGVRATVFCRQVPKAWKLKEPIDEKSSFVGLLVKRASPANARAEAKEKPPDRLVFAAQRLAWYPPTPLGNLGFDVALLDDVTDRTAIGAEEREAFYHLLSAVSRANLRELERQALAQIAQLRETLRESKPDRAKQPELAHQLQRAEKNVSDVVPMFKAPAALRGKLALLKGDARRAVKIIVDDPDIVSRFNLRHYYEVEIFTEDSQNNPIVFCVPELPSQMPAGDDIHEYVRATGFLVKTWAYATRRSAQQPDKRVRQFAPLLIGQLQWISREALKPDSFPAIVVLGVVGSALLVVLIGAWGFRRRGRRFTVGPREEPPAPDFSKLDRLP